MVPTRLIQRDDKGQYLYTLIEKDGKVTAQRKRITPGLSFESQTEVLEGLTGAEQIVDKGFRELTEGTEVIIAKNPPATSEVAKN
ncbi:MAG: hypothetical protein HC811_03315 [Flammeovirgaceae bacterium]|nr:hypothetical protein [Flammeovirgaceae bacterium]